MKSRENVVWVRLIMGRQPRLNAAMRRLEINICTTGSSVMKVRKRPAGQEEEPVILLK